MATHQPLKNLYIVDLDQPLEGFHDFLSSWVYIKDGLTMAVDPGPRSTIPVLVEALKQLKGGDFEVVDHKFSKVAHLRVPDSGGLFRTVIDCAI